MNFRNGDAPDIGKPKPSDNPAISTSEVMEKGKKGLEMLGFVVPKVKPVADITSKGLGMAKDIKEGRKIEAVEKGSGIIDTVMSNQPEKKNKTLTDAEKQDKEIKKITGHPRHLNRMLHFRGKLENLKKGNIGEMRTDQYLREKGYKRLNMDSVTSMKDTGHHGIDGVYYNSNGEPKFLITDAKFGSAKLDKKTGQMSWDWINKHLDAAVGKEKADEIRKARKENLDSVCCCVSHVDKKGNVTLKPVDNSGKETGKTIEL